MTTADLLALFYTDFDGHTTDNGIAISVKRFDTYTVEVVLKGHATPVRKAGTYRTYFDVTETTSCEAAKARIDDICNHFNNLLHT